MFLLKYVDNLDSYLKDNSSLILLLNNYSWQPKYHWATLDVSSLYTNIPHNLGIPAVICFLVNDNTMPTLQKDFMLSGTNFILTHTVFQFKSKVYLQLRGTAFLQVTPTFLRVVSKAHASPVNMPDSITTNYTNNTLKINFSFGKALMLNSLSLCPTSIRI